MEAKQKSQIDRIKESVHSFLDKESGSLRERIATLFREQGVTIFSVLTAIGMSIGVLVEVLLPGGGGGSGVTTTKGGGGGEAKKWIKKKLEDLKNLLKKLADKFGAALPGILGSAVLWVINKLSDVVGAVAQNLWLLFVAAGIIIYEVFRKNDDSTAGLLSVSAAGLFLGYQYFYTK